MLQEVINEWAFRNERKTVSGVLIESMDAGGKLVSLQWGDWLAF
jgi:hypothetical protein